MKNIIVKCLIVGALIFSTIAITQKTNARETGASDALQELAVLSDTLNKSSGYSFTAITAFDGKTKGNGFRDKEVATYTVRVMHPDKLYVKTDFGNGEKREAFYDGKELIVLLPDTQQYIKIAVEGTVDQLLNHIEEKTSLNFPLSDFLFEDFLDTHVEHIMASETLPKATINNHNYDRVALETVGAYWQLWLEEDNKNLPAHAFVTWLRETGQPQLSISFSDWKLDLASSEFTAPVIKDGWKKIEH